MNQLTVYAETVVGNSTDKKWSQAHVEVLPSGKLSVFVVVSLEGSELLDLSHFGSDMIEQIGEKAKDIANRSLDGLKSVVEGASRELPDDVNSSVVGAIISDQVIYVAGYGQVDVLLGRDSDMIAIFEGKDELYGVSGRVKKDDGIIIGTHEFLGVIDDNTLEKVIFETEGAREILAPSVVTSEDSSGMAGIVLGIGEKSAAAGEQKTEITDALSAAMSGAGRSNIKIKREGSKRRNTIIAGVLLILLFSSIAFGMVRRASIVKESRYRELNETVSANITEIRDVADINPQRAEYLLSESRRLVDEYIESESEDGYLDRARELYSLLDTTETQALRVSKVDIGVFIEAEILEDGFVMSGIYLNEEGEALVRGEGDRIYGVSLDDKSSYEINDAAGVRDISSYDEEVYGVRENDVVKIDEEAEVIIENDDFWEDVRLIDVYGGNVYLLDKGAGEIWSYPRLDNGYGARRRWLGTGIVLDFTNVVDMKIDGDIWLITSSGKLERYRRGVPIDYSLEGLPSGDAGSLNNPKAIYITEDTVYVLESGASRVVSFDIEGGYKSQYVNSEFSQGIDIVIYGQKGYVLMEDRIVEFGL